MKRIHYPATVIYLYGQSAEERMEFAKRMQAYFRSRGCGSVIIPMEEFCLPDSDRIPSYSTVRTEGELSEEASRGQELPRKLSAECADLIIHQIKEIGKWVDFVILPDLELSGVCGRLVAPFPNAVLLKVERHWQMEPHLYWRAFDRDPNSFFVRVMSRGKPEELGLLGKHCGSLLLFSRLRLAEEDRELWEKFLEAVWEDMNAEGENA